MSIQDDNYASLGRLLMLMSDTARLGEVGLRQSILQIFPSIATRQYRQKTSIQEVRGDEGTSMGVGVVSAAICWVSLSEDHASRAIQSRALPEDANYLDSTPPIKWVTLQVGDPVQIHGLLVEAMTEMGEQRFFAFAEGQSGQNEALEYKLLSGEQPKISVQTMGSLKP